MTNDEAPMRECLDYFLSANVHSVLDAGCGRGDWSLMFAKHGMHVKAYDFSPDAVAEARGRAKAARLKIDFEVGELAQPPFDYGAFDAIVAPLVLDRVSRREMFMSLERYATMLKKGGVLFALFHPYDPQDKRTFRDGELKNAFFGFRRLQIQSYPGGLRGYFLAKT